MGATKIHKKVFLPLRSNMQSRKWWFILIHDESLAGQKNVRILYLKALSVAFYSSPSQPKWMLSASTWMKHAIIPKVTNTFCTCILTLNNFWITATQVVRSILTPKLKPIYLYSISAGFVTTSAFHITCLCKLFHYVLLPCIASVRVNTLWQTNTAMKNLKTMHPQKSQSIPREM